MLRQAFQAPDSNFSGIGQFFLPVADPVNSSKNIHDIHNQISPRWN